MSAGAAAYAADGTRIAYQLGGSGPPLLLLAGQANSHRWWSSVRADFEAERQTVTMDYRGTGDSDKPDSPYSTPGFAEDAIAVLDQLGIERADVYGTSMGGRVAQWIAIQYPDRVRRLVLGCTAPGGKHSVERGPAVRRALASSDPTEAERALRELMYNPAWLAAHPGPHWTLGDPEMPPHARQGHLRASAKHDAWDALPQITAPTLVLHGAADELNPAANGQLLAERIPTAQLRLIPGGRHAYFEEFREIASKAVLDFLAE
ncbi:pimeloyl-ACP methyl ester carboxylesterase [Tamaricihabitans halophyticus]|uniref:Pimeloyl-ACP methyl ester carboxylesterase n=1 Tax=Tamaricihabitans halophyticus TaxID=1262583 RepID=A0A4R2R2D9_9PSEU|nr:alpha/beta fold hydrolase [Tamaricihabitans halophyticus]TCP56900.1 pimeloyl-ACP methyl ester carboxylesterase [Tamaricihabitans halophyticus]